MELKIKHYDGQTSYKTIIPGTKIEDGKYKIYLKAQKHIDGNGKERESEYIFGTGTDAKNYSIIDFVYKRPSSTVSMYPFYRISYIGSKYKVEYAINFDAKFISYNGLTISDAMISITNNENSISNHYTETNSFKEDDTSNDISFRYEYIPSFKLIEEVDNNKYKIDMTYKVSGYDTGDLYKRVGESEQGTYSTEYNQSDFEKLLEIIDEPDVIPDTYSNNWEEILPDNTVINASFNDIKNKTLPYIPKSEKYTKSSDYDYFVSDYSGHKLYYKSRLFRFRGANGVDSYYRRYDTHYGTSLPDGYGTTGTSLLPMDSLLTLSTSVDYNKDFNKSNLTITHTKTWDTTNTNLYTSDLGKINNLTLHLILARTNQEVRSVDIRNYDSSYFIDNLDNDDYTYYISGHTEYTNHTEKSTTPKLVSVKPDAEEVLTLSHLKMSNNKYRFEWSFTIENYTAVCFCVDEKQSDDTYTSKFKMKNTPYLYETYDGFEVGKTYRAYLKFDSPECIFSSPNVGVIEFTA